MNFEFRNQLIVEIIPTTHHSNPHLGQYNQGDLCSKIGVR